MRLIATLILALSLVGCAASTNLADGIELDVSAGPSAVGVGLDISPFDAACTLSKAVSWNWAENQLCEEGD